MKKLIALCLALTVFVWTGGPILAGASSVGTQLTKDSTGGTAPRVLVSWVARGDQYPPVEFYHDDNEIAGSQINPSGEQGVNTKIAMCAVAESDYGVGYIDNVYVDVFYPLVTLPTWHSVLVNQSGDGCGQFMQQDLLTVLSKADGITLFCNNVQSGNNDLPTFRTGTTYDVLCGQTGKLYKDEALVYCGTKDISYEDPAGYYPVTTLVQDKNGDGGTQNHGFTYQALTAFATDFTSINYGPVKLGINKIISGDLNFGAGDQTIKNVGNTRIQVNVTQDDMNLGKTSGNGVPGNWNVLYGARVGHAVSFANYYPEATTPISSLLDLSEVNEMDFSVLVSKFPFPSPTEGFIGTMMITAGDPGFVTPCSTR